MTEYLGTIPLWTWFIGFIAIATVATHFLARNRHFTLLVPALLSTMLAIGFGFIWFERYLDTHLVAHLNSAGEPIDFTSHGWQLLLGAWPLWVFPTLAFSAFTALLCWFYLPGGSHQYLEIIQQAGRAQSDPDRPLPTTSNVILKQLEINDLNQKLALAEEKVSLLSGEKPKSSVRVTKYVKEIRSLRAKITGIEEEMHQLRTINSRLETDLERANALIDQLMTDKFSD